MPAARVARVAIIDAPLGVHAAADLAEVLVARRAHLAVCVACPHNAEVRAVGPRVPAYVVVHHGLPQRSQPLVPRLAAAGVRGRDAVPRRARRRRRGVRVVDGAVGVRALVAVAARAPRAPVGVAPAAVARQASGLRDLRASVHLYLVLMAAAVAAELAFTRFYLRPAVGV